MAQSRSTVPTAVFAEQMTLLGELGYHARDARRGSRPLPRRGAASRPAPCSSPSTTAISTISRTRSRSCSTHGYPAVIFVPIGFLDGDSRPLPHEENLLRAGVRNQTLAWDRARRARAGWDSRRVARHRPPAGSPSSSPPRHFARDRASRGYDWRSGSGERSRRTRSSRGRAPTIRPEHVSLVQQAGYKLGLHGRLRCEQPGRAIATSSVRYNIEPYLGANLRARSRRRL